MSQQDQLRLQSQFITSVTHEFRTPLASLNASLEIFSDELDNLSRREMRELLDSLKLSATHLQTLVDNLLNTASIEAGHFNILPQPVPLQAILAETLSLIQPILKRRDQPATLTAALPLPVVLADTEGIKQVMVNLLMNASKYSPMGSTLDIQLIRQSPDIRVFVADRGAGLPEGNAAHLFERYVRQNPVPQDGLGLGLAVVKSIIEAHGGIVGAESRSGGGSIFWFTLKEVVDENPGG